MSDCCIIFSDDGDPPTLFGERAVTTRAPHECYECRCDIPAGSRAQYITGLWDGQWLQHWTCLSCADLRRLSCNGAVCYGELWDAIDYAYNEGALCHGALDKLTVGRAALEEWLAERDAEIVAEEAV